MSPVRHQFQLDGIAKALDAPANRWIFADETGLGKTNQAIGVLEEMNPKQVLIVCPALARLGWQKELERWWPNGPKAAIIDQSPTRKNQSKKRQAMWEDLLSASIRIISPELLDIERERLFISGNVECVVLDECHFYIEASTRRSRTIQSLLKSYRGSVLGLSATPIPDRIVGLANVIETFWPRRFGVFNKGQVPYEFLARYAEREWNGYGWDNKGMNPEHADELRKRLSFMMSRTTRKEVAHLLPHCQLRPLSVNNCANVIEIAREWAEEACKTTTHIVILTHLKQTARDIAHALSCNPFLNVLHIDGEVSPEKRNVLLQSLKDSPSGVLVTTMHAVEQSISLSWCHQGLFAELYWSPKTLVQTLGRFPRMDSMDSILLDVVCGSNSIQERMAYVLADKLAGIKSVIKEAASEELLLTTVTTSDPFDEAALLASALSCCTDEERESLDMEDVTCDTAE